MKPTRISKTPPLTMFISQPVAPLASEQYVSLGEHGNSSVKAIESRFRSMGLSNDGLSVMPVEAP